ncbi:hypothetical protein RND81_13G114500 [Saponaria officinalis]|uniref:Ig-like domain-containing protein n=1 Tax=Saponaria officinalis TaxID=3572 RepID=A0AAW1H090_SAPOF
MQCKSYFPVYKSHFDFNVNTNSGSGLVCNGNGTFQFGNHNSHGNSCAYQAEFGFKELLRQTMLMQEVTFKDQVQELHQIYRRHRELMTEIKTNKAFMKRLHSEVQSSNSSAILTSSCRQASYCITEYKTPDVSVSLHDNDTLDKLVEPKKVKTIGGKILDLELPAEVYIDNDEWESLGDAQYTECLTSAGCVTDLNEPPTTFHLENCDRFPEKERDDDSFNNRNAESSDVDKNRSCRLGKNTLLVQALASLNNQAPSIKTAKFYRKSKGSAEQKFKSFNSGQNVSAKENGINLPDSLDGETMRKSKRYRVVDINLPCDPASDDDEPVYVDDLGYDCKTSGHFDLNMCMTDDKFPKKYSSPEKNITEIDLEAPTSPQVAERPPPRGDSEDTLEACVLAAAEAIVSMSCKSKTCLFSKTKDWQNREISDSVGLEWFAGLVHSLSTALDTDNGALEFDDSDDFEALTLNLTETKPEEYLCKNSVEISSQTFSASLIVQTKGRTRSRKRLKRRDFQREVLPSIASLSRYEVTEDIHLIEGLMEVAGTPWHLKSRRVCRTGRKSRVIKQHTPATDVFESEVEFGMSWGKGNRRPRGHRSPVSPNTALLRWLKLAA